MSKPSAKRARPKTKPTPATPTHITLPIADAQRLAVLLGEVPCKYGVAWALELLRKARTGTIEPRRP